MFWSIKTGTKLNPKLNAKNSGLAQSEIWTLNLNSKLRKFISNKILEIFSIIIKNEPTSYHMEFKKIYDKSFITLVPAFSKVRNPVFFKVDYQFIVSNLIWSPELRKYSFLLCDDRQLLILANAWACWSIFSRSEKKISLCETRGQLMTRCKRT